MQNEQHENLERTNALLKNKLLRWCTQMGAQQTPIAGLMLSRRDNADQLSNCFYQPTVGVIVQGYKKSIIGSEEFRYGELHSLVVGVDMPSVSHFTVASPENPFLAISLKLDKYLITQLIAEAQLPHKAGICPPNKGACVAKVDFGVLDAFLRLVELLEKPEQISVLAPMLIREIHYRLLIGPQGECLRMVNTSGTQSNQIAKAISWLRGNYKDTLQVEALAKRFNMGTSTFHRHFRQMTTLSPLQFQKRLRLYEAQRLMLSDDKDASGAALAVGYESATQFNREYKRLFGEPPFRDINKLRATDSHEIYSESA